MSVDAHDVAGVVWRSRTLWDDLVALCATGGRFAGTESETRARAWGRARLAEAIGAPVQAHHVAYEGWARERCTLRGPAGESLAAPLAGLVAADAARRPRGPRLWTSAAARWRTSRPNAADIPGRIVLVRHEYMFATGHVHRRRNYEWAMQRGAAAFLIASPLPGQVLVTGSSGTGAAGDIPAAGITQEAAATLRRAGARHARAGLEIAVQRAPTTTENLTAEIPGRG